MITFREHPVCHSGIRIFLLIIMLCLISHRADAATSLDHTIRSGPEQTAWSTTSASVSWTLAPTSRYVTYPAAAGIKILVGTNTGDLQEAGRVPLTTTAFNITGLAPGSVYHVRLVPYAADGTEGFSADSSQIRTCPDGIQNFKQTAWYRQTRRLEIEWTAIPFAQKYEITLYDQKMKRIERKVLSYSSAHRTAFTGMKSKV